MLSLSLLLENITAKLRGHSSIDRSLKGIGLLLELVEECSDISESDKISDTLLVLSLDYSYAKNISYLFKIIYLPVKHFYFDYNLHQLS